MIRIKGGIGKFRFGYDTETKMRWVVLNHDTKEIVAEVSNMAEAIVKAKHHDFIQKNPEVMEYL